MSPRAPESPLSYEPHSKGKVGLFTMGVPPSLRTSYSLAMQEAPPPVGGDMTDGQTARQREALSLSFHTHPAVKAGQGFSP